MSIFPRRTKENANGSNRKASEDSLDSQAINITVTNPNSNHNPNYATGGPVSPGPRTGVDRPDIETVESDMPILAHRIAHLYFDGRKPFGSISEQVRFGVDEDAVCRVRYDPYMFRAYSKTPEYHSAPGTRCSCGYYALPSDVTPWADGSNYVTLMVELSGRVVEHEFGYRAEHQRIIECQIPACPFCNQKAEFVMTVDGMMTSTVCSKHIPLVHAAGTVLITPEDVAKIVKVPVTCQGEHADG